MRSPSEPSTVMTSVRNSVARGKPLLRACGPRGNPLLRACNGGHEGTARMLLDRGEITAVKTRQHQEHDRQEASHAAEFHHLPFDQTELVQRRHKEERERLAEQEQKEQEEGVGTDELLRAPHQAASALLGLEEVQKADELMAGLAEEADATSTVRVTLKANTTYDLGDLARWPFDFGATRAAVVIEGSGSVLDAHGLTSTFHLSVPWNRVTLLGLILLGGNASCTPASGGTSSGRAARRERA